MNVTLLNAHEHSIGMVPDGKADKVRGFENEYSKMEQDNDMI
jgi:hypothetical protein